MSHILSCNCTRSFLKPVLELVFSQSCLGQYRWIFVLLVWLARNSSFLVWSCIDSSNWTLATFQPWCLLHWTQSFVAGKLLYPILPIKYNCTRSILWCNIWLVYACNISFLSFFLGILCKSIQDVLYNLYILWWFMGILNNLEDHKQSDNTE